MKRFLFLLSLLSSVIVFAQKTPAERQKAEQAIEQYGDLYFKLELQSLDELKQLPSYISIDHNSRLEELVLYAYIPKPKFKEFLALELPFEVVAKNPGNKSLTMATSIDQMSNWDRYPTYQVYLEMMQKFADDYPEICRLETIGQSQEGRNILVLKITDNPDVAEDEPEFFYTAQMHGDELVAGIMMLRLIDRLLTNYGTDERINNLINNVEIWINPYANPDGVYAGGNHTVSGASRYLSNYVDPNRNFPAPPSENVSNPEHPDYEPYAQETLAMMSFADAHNFNMSANLHNGAEVVNYPWDVWESNERVHADNDWWELVSLEYANNAMASANYNGYFTDVSSNGITLGGDWYVIGGGRQDYMTYHKHGREFTLELSDYKMVNSESLPTYWGYNAESFLLYMEQSLYGLRGIIKAADTDAPLKAKVEIVGHDMDNSFVFSTEDVGDYHRYLVAGTYDVTYSAEGYVSQTHTVSVSNHDTTTLDVVLEKEVSGIHDETLDSYISIAPNPITDNYLNITVNKPLYHAGITLSDMSGRLIHQVNDVTLSPQEVYTVTFEKTLSRGTYIMTITTQDQHMSKLLIKS